MSVALFLLLVIVFLASWLYLSFQKSFKTWKNLDVPHLPPVFPFGSFVKSVFDDLHFGVICQQLYEELKSSGECCGVYMFKKPAIFVTGPEFAKTVLVRDFSSFVDRGVFQNPKDDPLSANLFFNEGHEWKSTRNKLSIAFTSGKMKMMFHTLVEVGDTLVDYMRSGGFCLGKEVDVLDLMARFTTDVVSSCIFGLEGKSIRDANSEFRQVGRQLMRPTKLKNLCTFLATVFKKQACKIGYRMFDQESTDFFYQMVQKTIKYRRENNVERKDLLQIMMELQDKDEDPLTLDEMAANAFVFFFAGFETSSTTLTNVLFNLARNKDIQVDAREEVRRILQKHEGNLTYEVVGEMNLLERIILETLRLFPPVATLHRITNKPYTLPNGSEVPVGTMLIIPVYGFHHDNDIYPDAEKFDPSRFTEEERSKRHPFAFLPFGEGPRICIGTRFAMMQMKVCLIRLLSNFEVDLCEKTEIPIKVDSAAMTYVPDGQVWLQFKPL